MLLVTLPCDTVALLLAVHRDEEDGVATVIDRLARFTLSQSQTNTILKPWERRRGKRLAANDNAPDQCRIKGNINAKGERIYHTPGGEWYDRTRIDPAKGERWFCTEAEARDAGWRPIR